MLFYDPLDFIPNKFKIVLQIQICQFYYYRKKSKIIFLYKNKNFTIYKKNLKVEI